MRRKTARLTLKLSFETIRLLGPPGLVGVRGAYNESGQYPTHCPPTLVESMCPTCAPDSVTCVPDSVICASAGDCGTYAPGCTTK
jgi:hypothetical protein